MTLFGSKLAKALGVKQITQRQESTVHAVSFKYESAQSFDAEMERRRKANKLTMSSDGFASDWQKGQI